MKYSTAKMLSANSVFIAQVITILFPSILIDRSVYIQESSIVQYICPGLGYALSNVF